MRKLKAKEKKEFKIEITYIVKVGFINAFNPYLLPLFSFFNFDFSFLILPNIISNNTVGIVIYNTKPWQVKRSEVKGP